MLQNFIQGYIACALWSSTDSKDVPLDANYTKDDFASGEAIERIVKDCSEFYYANKALLERYCLEVNEGDGDPWATAGHDFWLTRNGHGCGYFDRGGVSDEVGDALTEQCKKAGECHIYESEGFLYFY